MLVLAINCGSSSLKYALFEAEEADERPVARGAVERIGEAVPDHAAAVDAVFAEMSSKGRPPPDVVGHRVVHGGATRSTPALVDEALLASLRDLVPFAPLHLPAEIRAMRAVAERWPGRPQVACFDTAFHRTIPAVAQRYALPENLFDAGVRRYGFHGLSYEYVVATVGARGLGRAVLAHLGSGASMVAVCDGRAVDTTMGFTPSGGLVMATRAGDLDPGLFVYLVGQGYDARSIDELVNNRAGMLALSGSTGDVRELLARRDRDPRAALALDVFAWNARKWVGAMAATIGGIETLVFTGGIGENAAPVRAAIAAGLEHLGVLLDDTRNARGDAVVSRDGARCRVRVVRTDEERIVARHARRLVS
ncbi:MAG TPA: acetate/propionate family kinase [Polyangiaceae bacterium]|nr:acetate/propionate family kinase [Polyangiaceae bacterium]